MSFVCAFCARRRVGRAGFQARLRRYPARPNNGSALADPTRRAILARLALGETSVTEIAKPFDMSLPAVSKHLKVLEHAGLIARGREAQWRPCRLEAAPLRDLADWLDHYRRFWDASFDRLDDYLREVQSKPKAARSADTGKSIAREFIIARVVDAPRDLAWKAWTEAEHLARWWGPQGFPISVVKLDLRGTLVTVTFAEQDGKRPG
jgi:DNA-binding transcriptional ArsR family regulator